MATEKDLTTKISSLLNAASRENASDTPDFILAEFMVAALNSFEAATRARTLWHGGSVKDLESDAA